VKVVLTGDGGDELLAGYPTYRALRAAAVYLALVPRAVREALNPRLAALLPVRSEKMAAAMVAGRFLNATTADLATAHASWRTLWSHGEIDAIVRAPVSAAAHRSAGTGAARGGVSHAGSAAHEAARYAARMLEGRGWNLVQRAVYADVSTWLVDSILAKVDRATMAYGLEARSPLLDARLFELSFATLLAHPRRWGGKRPLRVLAERLLGADIAAVPKEGFQTPFADWLAGALRPYLRESLVALRTTLGAALDHDALDALEREHAERRRNHDLKLWTLLALAEWARVFPGVHVAEAAAHCDDDAAHAHPGDRAGAHGLRTGART
jgi:asparagine synthase (glutamine-hydrolysing)